MDGVSGAAVLSHLLETSPDAPEPAPRPWTPQLPVRDLELLARGLWSASSRIGIGDVPGLLRGAGTSLARTLRFALARVGSGEPPPAMPFQTPVLRFNRAISPRRSVAFGQVSLDDVKRVRHAFGATVNDVVLTACSLALRDYLQERGELPDIPLVAAVPVAVGGPGSRATIDNRVSAMFVRLPVHLADPMAQLEAVRADTAVAKSLHGALGASAFMQLTQVAPPLLFAGAMQLYSSLHLADRHRPPVNLVVSNIPGPPFPLYAAGARVEAVHPLGPILEGIGLNLSVLSNAGRVDLGAIACRDAVPDVERITAGFSEAVDRLVSLTRAPRRAYDAGAG
jgi:WS/DGAT/MGAT family acyltransferase